MAFRRLDPLVLAYAALTSATAAALVVRSAAEELPPVAREPLVAAAGAAALSLAALGWLGVALFWRRLIDRLTTSELALIALLTGVQFAVAWLSRLLGTVLYALLGPYGIFVSALGDECVSCLLLAALVVLVPRPGTAMLSLLGLLLLNSISGGLLNVAALLFASVSVAAFELCLAALGVTFKKGARGAAAGVPARAVCRTALAIGLANALSMALHYTISVFAFRLQLGLAYMLAVTLVAGLVYGGLGAAAGAVLGYRLRRVAA
jgi:hypothetical protein